MFEIRRSEIKKHQELAGIAGGIGFLLGIIIPGVGLLTHAWRCPFGTGSLQAIGFLTITGFGGAIVLGNLVAFLLVGIAKYQLSRKAHRKQGDTDGN